MLNTMQQFPVFNTLDDMRRAMKAFQFADAAHRRMGQVRKYSGEEYIVHPLEVAGLMVTLVKDWTVEMYMAALLHDTLEDTDVTEQMIFDEFGLEVLVLVAELTDRAPAHLNRAGRKAFDRDRLAKVSAQAQSIKVCDLISNTASITSEDPKFALVYVPEKIEVLRVLGCADQEALSVAWNQIERAALHLGISLD